MKRIKKFIKTLIDNGVIISIALGTAYILTYYYQKGKLSHYGVPLTYIDLSLNSILNVFTITLSAGYSVVIFINIILENSFGVYDYKAYKIIVRTLYFGVFTLFFITLNGKLTILSLLLIVFYVITLVSDIIMPIIKIKDNSTYLNKWRKYSLYVKNKNEEKREIKEKGLFSTAKKDFLLIAFFVCILLVLCNSFYSAGIENAKDTEAYYIASDYSNRIIVHNTAEYYILMDVNDNSLVKKYQIVPIDEIGTISYKHTGRLTVDCNN